MAIAEVAHTIDSQFFVKGSLTATDNTLTQQRFTTWSYVAIQLTGTWSGTVTFETTGDPSPTATWVTVSMTPSNSITLVTTATGNGLWYVQVTGFAGVRARFTTATSGTVVTTIKALPSQS